MQIFITIFLAFLCLNVQAQNCPKYDKAMNAGHNYLNKTKQPDYDKALIEFQAAQIAARECGIITDKPAIELKKVFDGLKKQRDDAVNAKREAETQKAIAESNTKEAVAQKEANQIQLARNYWNTSQIARTENNLLEALHFTAEAVAINRDKNLSTNLLVDIETYLPVTCLKLILSHGESLSSAAFSSDGKKILTAGEDDHTARLWDAETGKQIGYMIHERIVDKMVAVISQDGKWFSQQVRIKLPAFGMQQPANKWARYEA
jgi:hypothetical protein